MSRSTFSGPVLVGDNRFGPQRNVGTATLSQTVTMNFANTTPNTASYGGSNGVFVASNGILNGPGQVFTPGSNPATLQTITADSGSNFYRGVVFYVPVGSKLQELIVDVQQLAGFSAGSISNMQFFCSNQFNGSTGSFFNTNATGGAGRVAMGSFTATQIQNQQATTADVITAGTQPNVSQVVTTCNISGTSISGLNAGIISVTLRYTVPDNNLGNATTYPYGNLD